MNPNNGPGQAADLSGLWNINMRALKAKARERDTSRQSRQAELISDRQLRLKQLQAGDLIIDNDLLHNEPNSNNLAVPGGEPWFISYSMSGKPGYILQAMGKLLKSTLPPDFIIEIDNNTDNKDWRESPYPGHAGDIESYGDGHDDQQNMWYLSTCSRSNTWAPHPGANDRTWGAIRSAFDLLQHLRRLRRFTDGRNPEVDARPLPDGSNLTDPVLRASWALHRSWIRALHYRTLYIGPDTYGWDQIRHILKLSLAMQAGELIQVPPLPVNAQQNLPGYHLIRDVYIAVSRALEGIADDLQVETRPLCSDGPYTMTETIQWNLGPDRFARIFSRHFDPLNKIYMLWASLLHCADDFENRMDREYVEDCLINKRVVIHDEKWTLINRLDEYYTPADVNEMFAYPDQIDGIVHPYLRKISEINRQRRNYLLLRDWSKRRPWKQLYHVFNTQAGELDHYRQPIADFYTIIDTLNAIEPGSENPSRKSNIWSSLFTIHPISSHDPSRLESCNYSGGCVICQEDFRAPYTIAQLHCNHLFHYTCIRDFWDLPGRDNYSCPICREGSIRWLLHEQAGIKPEVMDVYDSAEITGLENTLGNLNMDPGGEYWLMENQNRIHSTYWRQEHGNAPRNEDIEMYQVRQRRRERNKEKREEFKKAGGGIAGLNPSGSGGS